MQLAMPLAASRSPPKPRPAQTVGAVLVPGCMSVLPKVGEFEIPPGPRLDEPSWRARRLWLAALEVMLNDARGKGFGAVAHREMAMSVARSWLRRPSADRDLVLELCGVDVGAFETRGLARLEQQWRELDDELKLRPRHEYAFRHANGRRRVA